MIDLAFHIRDAMIEASAGGPPGTEPRSVSRIPVAVARDGDAWTFGDRAVTAYLTGRSETLEVSLGGPAPMPLDPSARFLPAYFAGLAKSIDRAGRAIVCLPETWRATPPVPPAWIDRELRQALPVRDTVFIGAGQAAGAFAIQRARQACQAIGTTLLVVTASESDGECALFSVEQPGDRLRPRASFRFPGLVAFDRAMGTRLTAKCGGSALGNALRFGRDRAHQQEAMTLEWPLIADLPGTEVMSSGGVPLAVEEFTACANTVWPTLSADLVAWIARELEGTPRGSAMWALTGEAADFPLLRAMIEQAVPARTARRIDRSLTPGEKAFATISGARAFAAGDIDPRCLVASAGLTGWIRSPDGTTQRHVIAFDPPEVGGYLAAPLRLDPSGPLRPIEVRSGMTLTVELEAKVYDLRLAIPTGRYFLSLRVDQARRACLEFVPHTETTSDAGGHISVPITHD